MLVLRLDEAHERVEQAKEEAKFEANKAGKSTTEPATISLNHQIIIVIIGHGSLMVH